MRVSRYVRNNLVALDRAVNAAFGGDPGETVSSRLGRHVARRGALPWYVKPLGWVLEKWDPGHLKESIEP